MPSKFQILQATKIIHNEGVIACPTESVYGLSCDPLSEKAVGKVLQLKSRPPEKGLILIASSLEQLMPFLDIGKEECKKITEYIPPMTWLVKKSAYTPPWIHGRHSKLAIRVSLHPIIRQLCDHLAHPLVSTSANPANMAPATSVLQARRYFKNAVDMYLNGETGALQRPTPISDLADNTLIRQ
ncbi:MAG TPA: Sua5/YciO/YrdC/YwlC family protein [Gammaproteobacteria bacterium]|nr:Sua5/YciO/YrdC/YwlC family protein [Gammaproteobacteria bacterium]